jgi:uncharacterized protein
MAPSRSSAAHTHSESAAKQPFAHKTGRGIRLSPSSFKSTSSIRQQSAAARNEVKHVSEAIEIVKRYAAAATESMPEDGSGTSAEQRLEKLLSLLDPQIRITVAASLPYGGEYLGHQGFLALGEQFGKTWQVLDNGAGGYADIGDGRVVGFYNPTFRSVATGRTVSFRVVEILTVKDGRIAELTPYYSDTAELVKAVTP